MTYTIKALEWEKNTPRENSYFVYPPEDLSEIYKIDRFEQNDGSFIWQLDHGTVQNVYFSLEAAKQAAQSHWESRLKEALEEVKNEGQQDNCKTFSDI